MTLTRSVPSLLFALALLLAACSSSGDDAAPSPTLAPYTLEDATEAGPYAVGVRTIEFLDESRETPANREVPAHAGRRLVTEIWYPAPASSGDGRDAAVDPTGAPYPLIIFAHGVSSSRVQSTSYARHLASHGYVVVAPDFPLSSAAAPGGPQIADIVNQPQDVSFLIDRMLALTATGDDAFEGAVDGEAIGMTGHSLGGFTTLLSVYGASRDARIKAALPLSASACVLDGVGDTADVDVPIMLMTGSLDLLVAPAGNRRAYELARAPRYWVELIGGSHIRFADFDLDDSLALAALERLVARAEPSAGGAGYGPLASCGERAAASADAGITLGRQQELLRTFATPFFDAYLRGDPSARTFLEEALPLLTQDAARFEFEAD